MLGAGWLLGWLVENSSTPWSGWWYGWWSGWARSRNRTVSQREPHTTGVGARCVSFFETRLARGTHCHNCAASVLRCAQCCSLPHRCCTPLCREAAVQKAAAVQLEVRHDLRNTCPRRPPFLLNTWARAFHAALTPMLSLRPSCPSTGTPSLSHRSPGLNSTQ